MFSPSSQSPTYTQLPVSYVSQPAILPHSFGEQSAMYVSQTQSGAVISQPPPQPFYVSLEEHAVQVVYLPGAYSGSPCYVPTQPPDKAIPRSEADTPQTDTVAMGTAPEEQMKEKLYRIFGKVIEEEGPLEVTDQKILNVFIKLTQTERKVIMTYGSIRAFLSKCSYVNITNNMVKICGPVPSVSPTLSSSEESNISSGDASCLRPSSSTSSLNVCSAEFIPRSYCSQMDSLAQPSTDSIDSLRMSGLPLHPFPNYPFSSVEAEHIRRSNDFAEGRMSSMSSHANQHEAVVQTCVLCSDKAVQADITIEDKSVTTHKHNALLLRAIQAEEKVIHLQKSLCEQLLKHHRSLVQDGYLKIINDAKKSEQGKLPEYISVMKMIETELLRVEALHETNLSELREGKELGSLPEISLKPSVLEKLISFSSQNPALKASGKDSKSNEDSLFEKINSALPGYVHLEDKCTARDDTAPDRPLPIGHNEKPVMEKNDKGNFPMFHYFPSSDISRTMVPLSFDQARPWCAPSELTFDYLSSCSVPPSGQHLPGAEGMPTAERERIPNKPSLVKSQHCDELESMKQESGRGDLKEKLPPGNSRTEQCNDQDTSNRSMLSQIYAFWQPGKTSQNGDQQLKNSDFSQDESRFPTIWNQHKPDTDVPSPSRGSTIPIGHLMSSLLSKQMPQSFPSAFPNTTSLDQLEQKKRLDNIENNGSVANDKHIQDSGKQTSSSSIVNKNTEADWTNPLLSPGVRPDMSSSIAGISEISLNDEMMEFSHQQTEDGEWKQVVKKHKKVSDANTSFEKMLQDIQSSVPKSSRQDVIKSVQEVKQRHGKLQGLNINTIKQEAVSILQERLDLPSQDVTPRTKDYDIHQSEANIKVTEGNPAYKTAICVFWQQGTCKKTAKECTYAHGPDDLRTKNALCQNQATKALFGEKEYDSHQSDTNPKIAEGSLLYKTAICVFWQQGICKKTAKECAYAHGKEELRKQPKNIMCQNIAAKGECPYGDKCLFAHSREEMMKASQKR